VVRRSVEPLLRETSSIDAALSRFRGELALCVDVEWARVRDLADRFDSVICVASDSGRHPQLTSTRPANVDFLSLAQAEALTYDLVLAGSSEGEEWLTRHVDSGGTLALLTDDPDQAVQRLKAQHIHNIRTAQNSAHQSLVYGRKPPQSNATTVEKTGSRPASAATDPDDVLLGRALGLTTAERKSARSLLALVRERGLLALLPAGGAEDLVSRHHISRSLADRLFSILELASRTAPDTRGPSPSQVSIEEIRSELASEKTERLVGIFLSAQGQVIAARTLAVGSESMAHLEPADALREAILARASSLILMHNHPSGNPTPSVDDTTMTARFDAAARILGITLRDHVIVAGDRIASVMD